MDFECRACTHDQKNPRAVSQCGAVCSTLPGTNSLIGVASIVVRTSWMFLRTYCFDNSCLGELFEPGRQSSFRRWFDIVCRCPWICCFDGWATSFCGGTDCCGLLVLWPHIGVGSCDMVVQLAVGVRHRLHHYGLASFFLDFAFDSALAYLLYQCSAEADWFYVSMLPWLFSTALQMVNCTSWWKLLFHRRSEMSARRSVKTRYFLLNIPSAQMPQLAVVV